MEEQPPLIPIQPPAVPAVTPQRKHIPPWGWGIAVLVAGLFITIAIAKRIQKPVVVTGPTPTPTMVVTPTPIRTLSPLATSSAFVTLDGAVASYSAAVKTYNTSDPSLSPPVLDLNLGF